MTTASVSASVSSVRDAIARRLPTLSTSERRLADFTLAHYGDCALLGISDLAAACGVSTATVSRYARAVGYRGYVDYRKALRDEVARLSSAKLFQEGLQARDVGEALRLSVDEDVQALRSWQMSLDNDAMTKAIEAISTARKVVVFGQGSSAYLAGYFVFNLRGLGVDAVELSSRSGVEGIARSILQINEKDLVIPIAFPRFTKLTIDLTETLAREGLRIHSITSSLEGTLARNSENLLLAPARVTLHSGSGVTAIAVIEALLSTLTYHAPLARQSAERLEALVERHVL